MRLIALCALLAATSLAYADPVLVRRYARYPDPGHTSGISLATWPEMTAALSAATGNQITVVTRFTNAAQVAASAALWIDLGLDDGFGPTLNATEVANIVAFISTGKRVVFMGDHNNWTTWRGEIHSIVGGALASQGINPVTTTLVHPLTAGVTTVSPVVFGLSSGGTSLFNRNFATLWGAGNVLTIMDVNVFDTTFWGVADNARFGANVAAWVAGSPVPEPASVALVALGSLVLIRRRRKAHVAA